MKRLTDAQLVALLATARKRAFAPISNFRVGAVVLGRTGDVYLGGNIEVPGVGLGQTIHAEQAALATAYMAAESGIDTIAVTAAPCGHCRQFLYEMAPDGDARMLVQGNRAVKLKRLLPQAFGPRSLNQKQGALPVRESPLELVRGSGDELTRVALAAAAWSHAPYSGAQSGVALQAGGEVFAGSYIENAAFNPSLSPLHVALAAFFAPGRDGRSITRAALVELQGAKIQQAGMVRAVMRGLAPKARVTVVLAEKAPGAR